jgi:hypothetical protein
VATQHRQLRLAVLVARDHGPHHDRRRAVTVELHLRVGHEVVGAGAGTHRLGHELLDLVATLRAPERPEQHLAVLREEQRVGVEVLGVEVVPVVDEELLDRQQVFEPLHARFEVAAHGSSVGAVSVIPRWLTFPSPRRKSQPTRELRGEQSDG